VGPLSGHAILVVADEPIVAMRVCDALADAGAEIVTAHDLPTDLPALNGTLSAAILDLVLAGGDTGAWVPR